MKVHRKIRNRPWHQHIFSPLCLDEVHGRYDAFDDERGIRVVNVGTRRTVAYVRTRVEAVEIAMALANECRPKKAYKRFVDRPPELTTIEHRDLDELLLATKDPRERRRQKRVRAEWKRSLVRARRLGIQHRRANAESVGVIELSQTLKVGIDVASGSSHQRWMTSEEAHHMLVAATNAYQAARTIHPKIVTWSAEDRCYIGTCPSLFRGGIHGPNELAVFKHLCRVVADCA